MKLIFLKFHVPKVNMFFLKNEKKLLRQPPYEITTTSFRMSGFHRVGGE